MAFIDELPGLGGLAGNGDKALLADPVFIEKVRGHRRQQQQQCQDGALLHVVASSDDLIDLDRQGGKFTADGGGVGEILQRLNEHQQTAGDDARQGQWESHRPEGVPAAGAHVAGGVFHRGVNGGQDTGEG